MSDITSPAEMAGDIIPGSEIPTFTMRDIDLDRINEFMDLMGDSNPVHNDAELATSLGLRGPVAQGPASLAYVLNMLIDWRPDAFLETLSFRFHDIVTIGDEPTARGIIDSVEPAADVDRVTCDVSLDLPGGMRAVSGRAQLRVPRADTGNPEQEDI
jgi:acyl dehydratase